MKISSYQCRKSLCGDKDSRNIIFILKWDSRVCFNLKIPSYQCAKLHCWNKMILQPSHLHNGKKTSLYWILLGSPVYFHLLISQKAYMASSPLIWHIHRASLNSLAPEKFKWNLRYVIFKWILVIYGWGVSCEIALIWMSLDLTDDQSTLVQVMAWCRQATSHYLNQCWPRSQAPYGITWPQHGSLYSTQIMKGFIKSCKNCITFNPILHADNLALFWHIAVTLTPGLKNTFKNLVAQWHTWPLNSSCIPLNIIYPCHIQKW